MPTDFDRLNEWPNVLASTWHSPTAVIGPVPESQCRSFLEGLLLSHARRQDRQDYSAAPSISHSVSVANLSLFFHPFSLILRRRYAHSIDSTHHHNILKHHFTTFQSSPAIQISLCCLARPREPEAYFRQHPIAHFDPVLWSNFFPTCPTSRHPSIPISILSSTLIKLNILLLPPLPTLLLLLWHISHRHPQTTSPAAPTPKPSLVPPSNTMPIVNKLVYLLEV